MASLAEKPTSDEGIKTSFQEFGNSIKWQAFRFGQKADTISCFFYYDRATRRFTGGMRVPEGQSVPDVNRLFTILLNRRDDAESASSEHQASTSAPNGAETASSDRSAETEAAAALCLISQPTSAVDSPKTNLLDEASHRATHETGVRSDVSADNQGEPGSPFLASTTRLYGCTNSAAQQQGLSTVGNAVQGAVPGRILKANNQSGRVRKALSPNDIRNLRTRKFLTHARGLIAHIGELIAQIHGLIAQMDSLKGVLNAELAAAISATRQMNQQTCAALAEVSRDPASISRSLRRIAGKFIALPGTEAAMVRERAHRNDVGRRSGSGRFEGLRR
ncbi:hypothetical protein CcaCcLH18_07890 [Colletotrichum camelliae]|nr:hypothetical protein CcaCcLH18_07890 [Colletotrichum camelliae]